MSCSDYVCLQQGPATFFDTELKGGAPVIANNLIPMLVAKLAPEFTIPTGKVYVQMRGPRFETKAEIRVVRALGRRRRDDRRARGGPLRRGRAQLQQPRAGRQLRERA